MGVAVILVGFAICCVFVITVLSLWAYSVGHK